MDEANSLEFILFWTTIPFLVVGFIGNVLVIRIVHKTSDMHTPTNYLLANMAFSDVITILLWPFYFFEFVEFICKFFALIEICIVVSCITLTVLTVERYHALLKPLRTGLRLTEDTIGRAIALIWIASLIICFPEFCLKEWSDKEATCIGPWTLYTNQAIKIYVIVHVTITFILLAVTFYCHGSLIRGLYFTNTVCPETTEERSSEKKKLVITLIVASAAFFIGFTPTLVFYTVVASAGDDDNSGDNLYYTFSNSVDFVFACSLCFNPILYAFRSTNFKKGFKRIMLCREPTAVNAIH